MQKTEKHCKNQCFCYHKTTKISPKTGPKTQNPPPGQATCGTAKKDVANQKIEVKKLKNTGFFSLFACRFWTGAFTNRCLPYCFLQCFLKASVTTYQKQEVLAEKCPTPPGKTCNLLRVPSGRSRPSTFGAGGFFLVRTCWTSLVFAPNPPQQVGITRTEVERYWKRRDESSKNFVDKFVGAMALYGIHAIP